ncbi:hypothetical protein, partial [Streptomyces sp. SID12501]|uniref:hypothetical protein n=1 Tax=Streptomyces sp. SID12501 TaxID=2706042 RepID=UPI00194502BF
RLDALPALLGASLGLLLTSLGTASVTSALVVYPVQMPGENPFGTKQGANAASFTSQLAGFTAVVVLGAIVFGIVRQGQANAEAYGDVVYAGGTANTVVPALADVERPDVADDAGGVPVSSEGVGTAVPDDVEVQ